MKAYQPFSPGHSQILVPDDSRLGSTENWTGDLSSGLFQIGEKAEKMHRLDSRECGLLNLVRHYDPSDRTHILSLFEQAATASSSFCFSTTIVQEDGCLQPLFCVGESHDLEERYSGRLIGQFYFTRFRLDRPRHPFERPQHRSS